MCEAQTKEDSCDIPVVDIDVILQNGNASTTPSPPVHPQVNANLVTSTAASDTLVIQNQNLSNDFDDQQNSLFGTSSPSSSHSQQEKSATPPKSAQTKEDSCDIPVVDIDVILQNGNASTTPSPPVHPQVNANLVTSTAASDTLVIQNQNLSNDFDDQALILPSQQPDVVNVQAITSGPSDHSHFQHETENSLFGTSSPSSSHSQQEKSATPPKSVLL
ncbi:hypothetical protein Bca52824_019561 [Brassica carinata]|uniref:Uncharacterized protein n=1 Tax=Brassica carinata TaxID=52824 RepID=A0A8X7VRM2_BRACI|nr:hypothetical protein Bca52824_019561 [Brassica carinata]